MTKKFNFRPIPANLADRYPDGDYTVGRGADPRGAAERAAASAAQAPAAKPAKPRLGKKPLRPAAE